MADRYRPPDRRPPTLGPYHTSPPPSMRHFGQPNGGDHYSPSQNNFSFRMNNHNAPQYPEHPRDFRAPRGPPRYPREPPKGPRGYVPRGGGARGRHRDRPFRPKVATAERPLLRFERGSTPEQLEGMSADASGTTYLNVDDLSDSDEQSMDESEAEGDASTEAAAGEDTKRVKLASDAQNSNDDAPKWSNAELYTALPPVEDATERKRRDVVKLIRKARVMAAKDKAPVKPLEGDDFISFGFEDDEEQEAEEAKPYPPLPSAPLMPQQNTPLPVDTSASENHLAGKESVASRLEKGPKRKYEEADLGGPLNVPRQKMGRTMTTNGEILADWEERPDLNPTPWIGRDHRQTENCGFRLHKEICDYFEFVKPKPYEHQLRQQFLDRLGRFIADMSMNECALYPFGSFAAGLYLPNSDMDVVAVSRSYMATGRKEFTQTKNQMYKLARRLEHHSLAVPGTTEVIPSAKVPLIKFVDPITRLNIDLSFENTTGPIANQTFQSWRAQFPAMPILVTLIKQFLMMRGLNNVANGGMGGFSVTCLVVSLLQNLPRVQMGTILPEAHLGEILLEFLDFYGTQLDIARTAIRMNPPGLIEKASVPFLDLNNPNKRGRLCIIDPNRSDNDISGGTREIELIFRRLSEAHADLLNVMQHGGHHASLLRCLIGGNYNDFLWHRWHLNQLHMSQEGTSAHNAISVG